MHEILHLVSCLSSSLSLLLCFSDLFILFSLQSEWLSLSLNQVSGLAESLLIKPTSVTEQLIHQPFMYNSEHDDP